jgi:hypothetical protein
MVPLAEGANRGQRREQQLGRRRRPKPPVDASRRAQAFRCPGSASAGKWGERSACECAGRCPDRGMPTTLLCTRAPLMVLLTVPLRSYQSTVPQAIGSGRRLARSPAQQEGNQGLRQLIIDINAPLPPRTPSTPLFGLFSCGDSLGRSPGSRQSSLGSGLLSTAVDARQRRTGRSERWNHAAAVRGPFGVTWPVPALWPSVLVGRRRHHTNQHHEVTGDLLPLLRASGSRTRATAEAGSDVGTFAHRRG